MIVDRSVAHDRFEVHRATSGEVSAIKASYRKLEEAAHISSNAITTSPARSVWPGFTATDRTTALAGALMVNSIFIDSTTTSGSPADTRAPSSATTFHTLPGTSAKTPVHPSGTSPAAG
jgi:hypothetical protein